ncbi:A/G-specific adenine glycosylase [Candidatus Pacearchaeota archaeon]|nr:A/G-specific adenine glycosylase [Candidatus Pacearchaeota archaeon]
MKPSELTPFLYDFYDREARVMPWRSNPSPYGVLVSEIMLQQTQVPRVIEKYNEFMETFPTIQSLAEAPTDQLLKVWQGLGYNRRALNLRKAAQAIIAQHNGKLPETLEELDALPGIGPATAASISAFGFNKSVFFIETNVRSVFIHFFFKGTEEVSDAEILPLVEQALDRTNSRKWYSAIMDYGTVLKKQVVNPSRKSTHYTKQSKFEGSERQLRGKILKLLTTTPMLSVQKLKEELGDNRIHEVIKQLTDEEFIVQEKGVIKLKS